MRTFTRVQVFTVAVVAFATVFAAPAAAASEILYLTKFADPEETAAEWGFPKGETEFTDDGFSGSIEPGVLVFNLDGAPNAALWPDFGENGLDPLPANQAIEARVGDVSGDDSALFGVRCRTSATGRTNGYAFGVGLDGYYVIARFKNGKATVLANKSGDDTTDAVDPTGSNVVRAECVGKKKVTLTLSVNGEEVASAVDANPPKVGDQAQIFVEVADGGQSSTEFTAFAAYSQ